jgi:hypothetical protein
MATVIITHKVGNFDTWLKGHQDRVNVFAPAIKSFKTFQDANDPKYIAMVIEVNDMEKFGEMMNDPKIQPYKDKHTVLEPVNVFMQVNV